MTCANRTRRPPRIAAAIAAFGRLDIVANCAGDPKRGDFLELTEGDWSDGFAVKFHGYVRMTRAAWPHLRRLTGHRHQHRRGWLALQARRSSRSAGRSMWRC